MTIRHRTVKLACVLPAAALLIAGCGGGGSGSSPPPQPANSAPVANPANLATQEDTPLTGTLSATDANGNTLTFRVTQGPASGTLLLTAGTGQFIYSPSANYSGSDEFQFTASDGRAESAPARVGVTISPVNDFPDFVQFRAPAFGEARQLLSVSMQARDVDGSIARVEVTAADGSALNELNLRADGFDFRMPDVDVVRQQTFRVRAHDAEGNFVEREFTTSILPLSASGKLTTLSGSPGSPGLHWVITGDGYQASERAALLERAFGIIEYTIGQRELAKHRSLWNVHVVSVASVESGVDMPSTGQYRDTAFDGAFDCSGIARLICVNWDKVNAQVNPEFAAHDTLLVIVNSTTYGGSGGSQGAVVSNHDLAAYLMLHEMGHSFAGLGDEYVDADTEGRRTGTYVEGRYPNITQLSDLGRVPWRHWFQDPNNVPTAPGAAGVGRFEGAYYSPTGFYRPTDNSFMRSTQGEVTVVQAEAWTRALYRKTGAILGSSPTDASLTLAANELRTFSVVRGLPASVQTVRWYLDGQEVLSARDADRLECCTNLVGSHVVRVDLEDISGVIRLPGATEGSASRSWNLVITNPGAAAAPRKLDAPAFEDQLFIRVRVDASGHHVEGITRGRVPVNRRDTRKLPAPADAKFQWALTDAEGGTLATGDLADPRELRGPLSLPGEVQTGHSQAFMARSHYIIRAPEIESIRYLRLEPGGTVLDLERFLAR